MHKYIITRINPLSVLKAGFCCGVCFGGLLGILLGIAEGDAIGLFGGLFLGFAGGSICGLSGLVCSAVFNALAPKIGGIAIVLQPAAEAETGPEAVDKADTVC
ncbi:MAG: hypothetical protein E6X17_00820 [Sporomusaceae bacterium]|nr:hypothetical protein [Sporomusaceae bacterium]